MFDCEEEEKTIAARFPSSIARLVSQEAVNRGEDVSAFVRRSVYKELARLGMLPDDQKRSLEVC